ncbi:MAG: tRNA lysidine(34) synthetase TilS [Gammaproteobacteria bacterium]|nr:tRNA lysidine(34) synthetase TilS [Gammaproteobacteria bacterium]
MRKSDPGFSVAALEASLFERLALSPTASFTVAFSGGLDSHVLLHALAGLRGRRRPAFALRAMHIDHGLHPDSAEWAHHCRQICAQLAVAFESVRVRVDSAAGDGLEAAARRARYDALKRALAPDQVLLTAHHQDDQAETVLLQLLRGAGMHGLAAIAPIKTFGPGRLARPLLDFTRADLRAYAEHHRLDWIDDESNLNLKHRRNVIRHEVLPVVRRHWPQAGELLARSARHAAAAAALLDALAADDLGRCPGPAGERATLSIGALRALPHARLANLLRYWLRHQGLPAPTTQQLEDLTALVDHEPASRRARLAWPGVEVWRYRDGLQAAAPLAAPVSTLDLPWDLSGPLELPQLGWRLLAVPADGQGLARARLPAAPLRVRLRHGGEVCRLPGRRHRHKLKKLLQASHVAPWRRGRLPLLYADGALAAVADLWVCEPYAARADEPGVRLVLQPL